MKKFRCLLFASLLAAASVFGADLKKPMPWDIQALSTTPAMFPAPGFESPGVKAVYFAGPNYQGKPTRVFAWYGFPTNSAKGKVPGMVLVHGGGGTAFADWVRLWTQRGYAAIAMDTCGAVPKGTYGKWERNPQGGPPGWGGFDKINDPQKDQWTYHAVADVVLAHSLLRSFPEVDRDRIGLTGISWGGYLTCITAGVDPRFQFAVPVYGCGFLGDNSAWVGTFHTMPGAEAAKWLAWWDPSVYLSRAKMPFLWVTGTTDFAYPLDSLQKSYALPPGPQTLAIRVGMKHAHGGPGENPEEIHQFANSFTKKGIPLAKITRQGEHAGTAWIEYAAKQPVTRAELSYTTDTNPAWDKRAWQTIPATLERGRASARIPKDCAVYFLNLFDSRDVVVSGKHVDLRPSAH